MFRSIAPTTTDELWPYAKPSRGMGRRLVWRWIVSGVRAYLASRAERRRQRRAEHELLRLDDRILKDIGIDRSEIGRVVRYGHDQGGPLATR